MRTLLRALLICAVSLCSAQAASTELRVLSWPGYVSEAAIRAFEARHKVSVQLRVVNSDEDLWALASANRGEDFDLIAVNTAELSRYREADLILPIRAERIPNTRNQLARFRQHARIPGLWDAKTSQTLGIPFTYSAMGLIYNRKRVPEAPRSMSQLWDVRYRGQIALHNSGSHAFSFTALTLGIRTPFRLDPPQFTRALQRLIGLRNNDPRFYAAPEDLVELFRQHDVALAFGNYGDQQVRLLRAAGFDVGYVLPQEGALAWLDCWAVLRGAARDSTLAEAWINHMLTGGISRHLSEDQGLSNTLADQANPSTRERERLLWLEPVEDPANRARHWERFLSGARYAPR